MSVTEFPNTPQAMFDVAAKHLLGMLARGEKRVTAVHTEDGDCANICMYREDTTPECPRRCAIGACIPDHLYDRESMENEAATIILRENKEQFNIPEDRLSIMQDIARELQYTHDRSNGEHQWQSELERIARQFSLTMPTM